jgi:phosphatidylglycerol lysyltransferase
MLPGVEGETDTTQAVQADNTGWRAARDLLRRVPLTLALLGIMLACALVSGAWRHSLAGSGLLQRVGYGLPALRAWRLWTLVAGIPFTLFPWMLLTIAFIIVIFIGSYEYIAGTARAAIVFLATQIGGALLTATAVIWPLAALGFAWPMRLSHELDVGASAGAYGCFGAITAHLPRRWQTPARVAVLGFLAFQLALTQRIWDPEHLLAALIGIGLGIWLVPDETRQALAADASADEANERPRLRRGQVRIILAALVGLAGLANILSALVARLMVRAAFWTDLLPFEVLHGTRTFVLVAGFGLLLLARGLGHGRRVAWLTALVLLVSSAASNLLKGLHFSEAALQIAVAGTLLWRARDFRARPDTPTVAGVARTVGAAMLGLPLYAALGFVLLRGRFRPDPTLGQEVREFLARLTINSTDAFQGTTFRASWFLDSISFIWVAVLLFSAFALLRAVRHPSPERPGDRERALALLRRYGRQSIAHMTTWPGNTLMLNGASDAYIAYRVVGGVALALGDPIGDEDGCARAIEEFLDLCASRGWTPCFYAATDRFLPAFREHGLDSLQVAEDAAIDLPGLEFKGKSWQDVRTALNKAERDGIACEWISLGDAPPAIADQIAAISARWTAEKELPEMGFTLGTLEEARNPDIRTAVAVDAQRTIHGFTTWLPVYTDGAIRGWTIDLMRRREGEGIFRNVMEFLIARAALTFREEGAATLSLSSAPLARAEHEGEEARGLQRALNLLADRLEPFYSFRSLLAFKQKFRPRWEPVYIVFPDLASLPRITLAIVRAYLPGLGLREVREMLTEAARTGARRGQPLPPVNAPAAD